MNTVTLSLAAALAAGLLSPISQAQELRNLTTVGASIAAGNAACPDQAYYRYVGGKKDNFAGVQDPAYPSPDLITFMTVPPSVQGYVDYDIRMQDGRLGDTFNLQNTRSVCHALIEFKAKSSAGLFSNDGLTLGHLEPGGTVFNQVASIGNPGGTTASQTYAFDAAGLGLLSQLTGVNLDKTVQQSILDLYLQDDTKLDYFQLYVWYGKNCRQTGGC
jgi:hypothetical protein